MSSGHEACLLFVLIRMIASAAFVQISFAAGKIVVYHDITICKDLSVHEAQRIPLE